MKFVPFKIGTLEHAVFEVEFRHIASVTLSLYLYGELEQILGYLLMCAFLCSPDF
jgi:hypothetical protein